MHDDMRTHYICIPIKKIYYEFVSSDFPKLNLAVAMVAGHRIKPWARLIYSKTTIQNKQCLVADVYIPITSFANTDARLPKLLREMNLNRIKCSDL